MIGQYYAFTPYPFTRDHRLQNGISVVLHSDAIPLLSLVARRILSRHLRAHPHLQHNFLLLPGLLTSRDVPRIAEIFLEMFMALQLASLEICSLHDIILISSITIEIAIILSVQLKLELNWSINPDN